MASSPVPSGMQSALSSQPSSSIPDLSISDPPLDPPAPSSTSKSSLPPVPLSHRIADLLLWHDVLSSSLALSSGVLFVLLIQVGGYSLLTLLCYLSLLQLLICAVFINGTRFLLSLQQQTAAFSSSASAAQSTAPPSSSELPAFVSSLDVPSADYSYVSQDLVLEYSGAIADSLNSLLHSLTLILRCRSHLLTVQVALVLLSVALAGRLVDGVTLLGLMWVGLFTAPKLYVRFKDDVDERVGRVKAVIDGVRAQIAQYLPDEESATGKKRKAE